MEPTAGDLQLVPGTAKEVPAPYTSCCRMALCVVVATSIIMVTLGVLMASLSTQGVDVEHTAELQGVRYAHSLQHEASDYYRTLTVFVHFRLHFLLQASQSLSLGLEEELLRQGLRARLQGHGIPLAAHGTIVSAQLTGNQKAPWTERDLKSGHCPENTFSCRNGQCVTKVNPECDDRVDCSDGSDEAHCDCGLQPGWKTAGRIVGGVEASPGEFPWQVSLRENKEHFCGAAVIGARWLVSAAHCFNGFQDPAEWVAYAGTTHLSGPVCLPAATHVFPPRRKCLISGWGYLKEDFLVKPETLQKATVELLDQGLCASLYGHSLTDRMLCAGYLDGKVDSCQGDSGGPLVCEEPSGRFFLAGIVSWGIGCAEAGRPGVYARVTRLRDWILEAITTAGRPLAPTAAPASTTASTARPPTPESPTTHVAPPSSRRPSPEPGPHSCAWRPGGSGVSERPLVGSTKVELVRAHLGTASLTGVGGNPVKMGLKRAVLHPQYNPGILDFDVAVLELAGPLGFNKYIQPVCLPLAIQKFPVGRKCMISGWGNTQEGNATKPDILQRASVGIIDQKACSALYNSSLTDRMLCAGFLEGKVDSCQGDSGGPLACEEAPGVFYLAGIVSWGVGCAQARRPGVYARITRLKGWILDTMSSGLLPTARTPATRQSSGTAAAFTVPGVPASTATPSATSRATSQPANMTAATVTATAGGQTPLPDPPRTTVGFQPP
uniref:Peptidase S1 domain-containing protein n=1 Tax=Panthera tigris altaica TaxID=74533 RepID=A0A8C9K9G3_PANTA